MADRDSCLIRHLLWASVQAYHEDPGYGGVPRWQSRLPPIPGAGDRRDIDLALAGTFEEGIVVAFRGTLPPLDVSPNLRRIILPDARARAIAADWLNGAHLRLVELRGEPPVIPGGVHKGFAASLAGLWPSVFAAVETLRAGNAAFRLYFTGHSKGGALANLAALAAHGVWGGATIKAVTFGAPRTGDQEFATAYAQAGIECRRYEVIGDRVPGILTDAPAPGSILPRKLFAVGTQLLREPTARPGLFSFDVRGRIPSFVAAHLPYRGFGYGDHVCTDELCDHDWN